MTAAVVLLWAGCLWSITRSVLCLLLAASFRRQLLVLAVLALALSCAHEPKSGPEVDKNAKRSSCNPRSLVVK